MRKHIVTPVLATLTAACAAETDDPAPPPPEEAPTAVSGAALDVERAGRMLDRGQSPAEAQALLEQALASDALTAEERAEATVALSRAHEELEQREASIAVVERELSRSNGPNRRGIDLLRERLAELLVGSQDEEPRLAPDAPAPPFARLLSGYFTPDDRGKIVANVMVVGGNTGISRELGLWDVAAGYRAERERTCPLCDDDVSYSHRAARSNWMLIPARSDALGESLVVYYYDLGKNRIPARYEDHLPLSVAEIDRELEAGRSLVVAEERPGAPPTVLLATPRTAMLPDLERRVAQLETLPTEMKRYDLRTELRPAEIEGTLRADYFPTAKRCYDGLLNERPQANGEVVVHLEVARDGTIDSGSVEATEGDVGESSFLRCLEAGLSEVRFASTGHVVTVNYPLTLSPGDGATSP